MDFPKSVPSIGLVGGKFIDEDPLSGTPGSLIPSVWGNAVTDEILHVIEAAGLAPDEENNTQLLQAIQGLNRVLASQPEAEAGVENTKYMSPLRVQQSIAKRALTVPAVIPVSISKTLVADELGLVQIDATTAALTITLPAANAALGIRDVIVRRMDNTGNRLIIQGAGTDKIKFHTHLRAAGYSFFVLMGAGDYWHLRSDGNGGWIPVSRLDPTPVGRPIFETAMAFSPGGWAGLNGLLYSRADWPWVWDHAQQSGILTTEAARAGMEGCWTSGDGATTFRSPEGRGEFFRVLDESRGIDTGRVAGSYQKPSIVTGDSSLTSTTVVSPVNRVDNSNDTFRALFGYELVTDTYAQAVWASVAQTSSGTSGDVSAFGAIRPRNIAYPGRIKLI